MSTVVLPDEDFLKVLAKERSNLQFFSQILMLVISMARLDCQQLRQSQSPSVVI